MSPFRLRFMQTKDIKQVMEIEQQVFSSAWSADTYFFEVNHSNISHMLVFTKASEKSEQGLRAFLNRMIGRPVSNTVYEKIYGFGGLWVTQGEGHISTIAVDAEQQGNGYGELLLAAMIGRAIRLKANYMMLEVRVSNISAQHLYHKYGFIIDFVKHHYYLDDHEDAYAMRMDLMKPVILARFKELDQQIRSKIECEDTFTTSEHPRLK